MYGWWYFAGCEVPESAAHAAAGDERLVLVHGRGCALTLAIISDTHLPRGGRRLPEACVARLRAAAMILHAGDLVTVSVLEELRALGPPVVAVAGNVDEPALRRRLPARTEVQVGGARIGMVHDAGPARGRLERLRGWFPDADAAVFGHSHLPLHERAADGFQIFNPGSPTERRRAPAHSIGEARVDQHRVELSLIALD
jgi:putative phosphoesterase